MREVLRATIVMALACALTGCFTSPKVDVRQTELMPEEVARRIVAKYTSPGWAARPTLNKPAQSLGGGCPEPRVVRIQYSDIYYAYYMEGHVWMFKKGANAMWSCPNDVGLVATVKVKNEAEAQEFMNALVSLGAKLENSSAK